MQVLTNGLLSLNYSDVTSNFRPQKFPTTGSLIAPFWADADTRGIGRVYYRSTDNESLLIRMTQDVSDTFGTMFTPEYLFVSTWYKVGYYNHRTDKVLIIHACIHSLSPLKTTLKWLICLYQSACAGSSQSHSGNSTHPPPKLKLKYTHMVQSSYIVSCREIAWAIL